MESRSDGRKEKPPDGRVPLGRERRGGRGGEAGRAAVWAGKREVGRRWRKFGPRKREGKRRGWAGWAESKGRKKEKTLYF